MVNDKSKEINKMFSDIDKLEEYFVGFAGYIIQTEQALKNNDIRTAKKYFNEIKNIYSELGFKLKNISELSVEDLGTIVELSINAAKEMYKK